MNAHQERLLKLASEIENRSEPLGTTPTNECWGALAASLAGLPFDSGYQYYGISQEEYWKNININLEIEPGRRNREMARRTREMAGRKVLHSAL